MSVTPELRWLVEGRKCIREVRGVEHDGYFHIFLSGGAIDSYRTDCNRIFATKEQALSQADILKRLDADVLVQKAESIIREKTLVFNYSSPEMQKLTPGTMQPPEGYEQILSGEQIKLDYLIFDNILKDYFPGDDARVGEIWSGEPPYCFNRIPKNII